MRDVMKMGQKSEIIFSFPWKTIVKENYEISPLIIFFSESDVFRIHEKILFLSIINNESAQFQKELKHNRKNSRSKFSN